MRYEGICRETRHHTGAIGFPWGLKKSCRRFFTDGGGGEAHEERAPRVIGASAFCRMPAHLRHGPKVLKGADPEISKGAY